MALSLSQPAPEPAASHLASVVLALVSIARGGRDARQLAGVLPTCCLTCGRRHPVPGVSIERRDTSRGPVWLRYGHEPDGWGAWRLYVVMEGPGVTAPVRSFV